MNSQFSQRLIASTIALTAGIGGTFLPYLNPVLTPAYAAPPAKTFFPDTEGYWGQAFIEALGERGIVTGYLDNTYRPEKGIDRDEFAAILRQAFSQTPERQLSSGSVYNDVPEEYWAAPAIEEAYEMGFMKGYPDGEFRPRQPVSKVEVLVSLAQNLDFSSPEPVAEAGETQDAAPTSTSTRVQRPLMFPLAITTLMQPAVAAPSQTTAVADPSPSAPSQSQPPLSSIVSNYYTDADQIPQYALDDVARATEAGIVVNYPSPSTLNPTEPATRGEVAALIHQALVHQGKISPLPTTEPATNYIVGR